MNNPRRVLQYVQEKCAINDDRAVGSMWPAYVTLFSGDGNHENLDGH